MPRRAMPQNEEDVEKRRKGKFTHMISALWGRGLAEKQAIILSEFVKDKRGKVVKKSQILRTSFVDSPRGQMIESLEIMSQQI